MEQSSLAGKFPELFVICNNQSETVAYFAERGWRMSFRRWLDERLQDQFRRLRDMLATVALSNDPNSPVWAWERNCVFFGQIHLLSPL